MREDNGDVQFQDDRSTRRERRLRRFAPLFRDRIAALTCCAPQAEDLAESFPGLLVALVSDVGTADQRAQAFETVLNGGSLRRAAQMLALPLWLRKVPPEAFREPIRHLPSEAQFTAKITNFIPGSAVGAGDWLEYVSFADAACDSSFALWVAKHCRSVAPSRRKMVFLYMAAWAWHCQRPETAGYRLLERPWSPKMGLRRANEELMRWRRRVDLACLLGNGIDAPWLVPGRYGGYDFVPLLTLDDFIGESRTMHNCLDQYADRLATGLIRIFSIRHDGSPVADIEVGPIPANTAMPSIIQIKAASNREAPLAVWQAAQQWLQAQDPGSLPRRPGPLRRDRCASPTESFWQPYLDWLSAEHRAEFTRCVVHARRRPPRDPVAHPAIDITRLAHRMAPRAT